MFLQWAECEMGMHAYTHAPIWNALPETHMHIAAPNC